MTRLNRGRHQLESGQVKKEVLELRIVILEVKRTDRMFNSHIKRFQPLMLFRFRIKLYSLQIKAIKILVLNQTFLKICKLLTSPHQSILQSRAANF